MKIDTKKIFQYYYLIENPRPSLARNQLTSTFNLNRSKFLDYHNNFSKKKFYLEKLLCFSFINSFINTELKKPLDYFETKFLVFEKTFSLHASLLLYNELTLLWNSKKPGLSNENLEIIDSLLKRKKYEEVFETISQNISSFKEKKEKSSLAIAKSPEFDSILFKK